MFRPDARVARRSRGDLLRRGNHVIRCAAMRCSRTSWSQRAVVLGFVALASAFSWTVPAWETPDEPAHFAYVIHLAEHWTLPVQRRDVFGEEHQAPLYYALAALPVSLVDLDDTTGRFRFNRSFGWGRGQDVNIARTPSTRVPLRGHELALRMIRMVSVIMAACTVMLTGRLASAIAPESSVAVMAMALAAFNPQFLFIGGGKQR